MDLKQKYREETNKEPYGNVEDKDNFTLDYVSWLEEQLRLGGVRDLLIAWEQFKKANWYESDAIGVEKMFMDKFQAIYNR